MLVDNHHPSQLHLTLGKNLLTIWQHESADGLLGDWHRRSLEPAYMRWSAVSGSAAWRVLPALFIAQRDGRPPDDKSAAAVSKLDTALSLARTVLTLRLAPVLLVVFVVVWPLAGFPWWPIVFVLVLGLALRFLGFGYLISGKRGPVLLVGLLVATTVLSWSPWAAVTAIGAALAARGLFRLPNWHLLAAGLVLAVCAGSGWTVETVIAAQHRKELEAQQAEFYSSLLLPRNARDMLGALMRTAADNDAIQGCALFTEPAKQQFAAAFGTDDCPAAIAAWHAQITMPARYDISVYLAGDVGTRSPDGQTATLTACDLRSYSALDGTLPVGGPTAVGRVQMLRLHGNGYVITDFQPC